MSSLSISSGFNSLQLAQLQAAFPSVDTAFYPATANTAVAAQTACGLYAGSGAPTNSLGNNGDFYFRSDGGALTTIYQRRAGVWTGIV